ncbi:MAG TPA: radical SAM protein [Myxococcota bacterium]|nr:radical SAM protein [Myxococcota bacterium]HQK51236.1 radical SAM protein [Myxococcota bacterium]
MSCKERPDGAGPEGGSGTADRRGDTRSVPSPGHLPRRSRRSILGYHLDPYPNPSALRLPPAPASLAELVVEWRDFLAHSRFARDIGLHLHVPYCRSKCRFCDCSSTPVGAAVDYRAYLEDLQAEVATLAPLFRDVAFRRLYIGGGTPNLLPDPLLASLLETVNRHFRTEPGAVRCIEFAPERTRTTNLAIARSAGINRLSLGVQTLTPGLLSSLGRPGASPEIALRALELVRQAGFQEVNLDLIFGLAGETPETFHRGLEVLLAREPDTITVQLVHDSKIAQVYGDRDHRRSVEDAYVDYVRRTLPSIHRSFPAYQGHLRPGVCVLVHRRMTRPWDQWLDFFSCLDRDLISTLGLGPMAHSRLEGRLAYQCQFGAREPGALNYVFHRLTEELAAFIDTACALATQGRFRLEDVQQRIGSVPPRLLEEIAHLERQGRLVRAGEEWVGWKGAQNPLMPAVDRLALECRRIRLNPDTPWRNPP